MKNEHQPKLRGEYIGGLLVGVGLGIYVAYAFLVSSHPIPNLWAFILGGCFIIAGSLLHEFAQRKRLQKDDIDDKHMA